MGDGFWVLRKLTKEDIAVNKQLCAGWFHHSLWMYNIVRKLGKVLTSKTAESFDLIFQSIYFSSYFKRMKVKSEDLTILYLRYTFLKSS